MTRNSVLGLNVRKLADVEESIEEILSCRESMLLRQSLGDEKVSHKQVMRNRRRLYDRAKRSSE
jgi:hypothetical protein